MRVSPDFVVFLGLKQSLTPSRNNGFLNMLQLMQKKALRLYIEAERGDDLDSNVENPNLVPKGDGGSVAEKSNGLNKGGSNVSTLGGWGKRIEEILEKELSPVELEVEDISYQHAGHAGGDGGEETHFNVKVVSQEFEGKSLVKRHRLVYSLLQYELQNGLHALSIVAKTPGEV